MTEQEIIDFFTIILTSLQDCVVNPDDNDENYLEMCEELGQDLEGTMREYKIDDFRTFEESGLLTKNKGIILKMNDSEF